MKPTHTFQSEGVTAGYDQKTILHDVSISIPSNKISIIIGANGCGKSTLLKTMARLIKPTSGQVTLDGKPIHKMPPKQLARVLGLLPQSPIVPEGNNSCRLSWKRKISTPIVSKRLDKKGLRSRY